MPFNLEQARKSGYSDQEIMDYLASKFPDFDISKAKAKGYSDKEIVEYLSGFKPPELISAPKQLSVPEWGREHPNLYGAFGAGKELFTTVGKPLLELGGMSLGGIVGAGTGPAGSVLGAGLGYASGKTFADTILSKLNELEGIRKPEPSISESLKRSGQDILSGMSMEVLGQGAGKVIGGIGRKLLAPEAKRVTPEVININDVAQKAGITLSPVDVTESKGLALVESMLEKSPSSADLIKDFRLRKQLEPLMRVREEFIKSNAPPEDVKLVGQKIYNEVTDYLNKTQNLTNKQLNSLRTEFLAKFGGDEPLYSLGLKGKELLKANSIAAHERIASAYNSVEKFIPDGMTFEPKNLQKEAKALLSKQTVLPARDKRIMQILNWASKKYDAPKDVLSSIKSLPNNIRSQVLDEYKVKHPWGILEQFYHDLNNLIAKENVILKSGGQAGTKFQSTSEGYIYNRLKKALAKDLENAAKEAGGEAYDQFKVANALYSDSAEVFKSQQIRRVLKAAPEKFIDTAFKPNGLTEVKLLKRALGPDGFRFFQQGVVNKILGTTEKEVFDPKYLNSQINRYGEDTISEIIGKDNLNVIKDIAKKGLDLTKQKPGLKFLKTLTNTYPDTIVDSIIGAPESKLQSNTLLKNIITIKKAVSPEVFKQISSRLAVKLFSISPLTDIIKPQTFARMVSKYDTRVLRQFYSADQVRWLKQLASVAKRLSSAEIIAGNPSGTGQTIMTWGTMGMIIRNPLKGAMIAISPRMMARAYLSSFGRRYFTQGFKVPIATTKGSELAIKLLAIMNDNDIQNIQ